MKQLPHRAGARCDFSQDRIGESARLESGRENKRSDQQPDQIVAECGEEFVRLADNQQRHEDGRAERDEYVVEARHGPADDGETENLQRPAGGHIHFGKRQLGREHQSDHNRGCAPPLVDYPRHARVLSRASQGGGSRHNLYTGSQFPPCALTPLAAGSISRPLKG